MIARCQTTGIASLCRCKHTQASLDAMPPPTQAPVPTAISYVICNMICDKRTCDKLSIVFLGAILLR